MQNPNLSCDLLREGVGWENAIGMGLDLTVAVGLAGTMSIPGTGPTNRPLLRFWLG
jgi:hypothetical protein